MPDTASTVTSQTRNVLMFGCGNMGQALLSGWSRTDKTSFTVIDPAKPDLGDMATVKETAEGLEDTEFDIAIIAVKPQLIPVVMEASGELIRSAGMILSIAAGVSVSTLEKQIGEKAIVRMMPNMPASVGAGLSGLYANHKVEDEQKALISTLAAQNGELIWLDEEDKIDRFTAVAGSGPGYVFEFLRLFTLAALAQGFTEDEARKLAVGTVRGTAEMALQNPQTLENLRNSVTSKNGTTQAGLEQFMRDGTLETLLQDTVTAAYNRAVELR